MVSESGYTVKFILMDIFCERRVFFSQKWHKSYAVWITWISSQYDLINCLLTVNRKWKPIDKNQAPSVIVYYRFIWAFCVNN